MEAAILYDHMIDSLVTWQILDVATVPTRDRRELLKKEMSKLWCFLFLPHDPLQEFWVQTDTRMADVVEIHETQDDFEVDEDGDRKLQTFVGKMPGSCNIAHDIILIWLFVER